MKSRSQTWSGYKHHNTYKALIGISPAGCVTFVLKLWSGKVSDKEITLKSGVLALLEDGDTVMADRGFDIEDILPSGVSLNIPPFKGAVLRDNARGNNFAVARVVWVKHRTFNGGFYKGNIASKYSLASNTECSFLM